MHLVLPLSDARERATEVMLAVIKGQDPATKSKKAGQPTFAQLAARYVDEHAKRKNKSWKQAEYLIRRHVLPSWGDLNAEAIKRSDVRALLAKIDGPSLGNQILAAVSAIYSWACNQEILNNNPCRGVERNAKVSRDRVLSDQEVPVFWQAFEQAGIAGAALQVLLLTGQRPGEISAMRWQHIADGWWTMPGAPDGNGWPGTKNSKSHKIWLPQTVQEILAELGDHESARRAVSGVERPRRALSGVETRRRRVSEVERQRRRLSVSDDESGFVFSRPRLAVVMRGIVGALGVERLTPHDLRRSFGTATTRLGFGRDLMDRILNHRSDTVTDIYDRTFIFPRD
jgi:integrase